MDTTPARGRALVPLQAGESGNRMGNVIGVSITAVVEFISWGWLSTHVGGFQLGVSAVLVALLGALLGGWIEYSFRRLFVAPGQVIDALQARVDTYEEGPRFHVVAQEPVTLAEAWPGDRESDAEFLCVIFSVRCTNEGAPGRAFDWHVEIHFHDGGTVEVHPMTSDQLSFAGSAKFELNRESMIWERTAKTMNRGDTAVGYFAGLVSTTHKPQLDEPWELVVACRDHQKRAFGCVLSFGGDAERRPTAVVFEPTLPRLIFGPSSHVRFFTTRPPEEDEK